MSGIQIIIAREEGGLWWPSLLVWVAGANLIVIII